jgi:hypothetical protein
MDVVTSLINVSGQICNIKGKERILNMVGSHAGIKLVATPKPYQYPRF